MTYFALAALINTFSSSLLGLFVYLKNPQKPVNKSFFIYCLSVAVWSFAYFFWQVSTEKTAAIFWCKALMMGAILIPVFQTRFIRRVLNLAVENKLLFLLYLYSTIFLVANIFDYIVSGVEPRGGFAFWPIAGVFFPHFLIVWIGIVVYNFILIFTNFNKVDKKTKVFLIYLLIATVISYIGGITNYPLWFNINIMPWGNILITAYVIIVAYAIIRNKFLNVELMRSELVIFIIWLTLVVDAFLSEKFIYGLIRFGVILLFTAIGWRYIKSVIENEKKNRQLEKDKKELVELDRMKDEFLQMATHELNTPITVIQGKLDMAINENLCELNKKQKEFLEPVLFDTMRLANLSKDILNVARIDQHRLALTPIETNINDLISRIVTEFRDKIEKNGNSIQYFKPRETLPKITIDQNKIEEVITNLINNANKFTKRGKISVRTELKHGNIVTSVSDSGVGIEKSEQKKIFEKFYQVGRFDPNNPKEQQGSGLGLFISKKIIDLHGGEIWVESEIGVGSVFYFSLPIEYKESKEPKKMRVDNDELRVL